MQSTDVVVVGGGLVGLATARALLVRRRRALLVLEAEAQLAARQSGRNSGVLHSGLYYRPGSRKARLCVAGRQALLEYAAAHGVAHRICGKLVVATSARQAGALAELCERGRANGLAGIERLEAAGIRAREPHVRAELALWVPQTGVVDFRGLAAALARDVEERGGVVLRSMPFRAARRDGARLRVETAAGELEARTLIACAGVEADRVARACGLEPPARIVPFRGDFRRLRPEKAGLVNALVYPVPDPGLPFLGVHLTRRIDGVVEAGPNAVLALSRQSERWGDVAPRDVLDMAGFPGFWRMLWRQRRAATAELRRSLSSRAFAAAVQELVPDLEASDLLPAGSGVRAQAVDRQGRLLDDFVSVEAPGMLHVLNAPSPAATACLALAEELAERHDRLA